MVCNSTVEFRLAGADDMAGLGPLLLDLGGPSYPDRFTGTTVSEFCRWKYRGNPSGNALVGVAVASGRIVSIVTGTPKNVQVGPAIYLAFELGDFITDPEYRKQGMFSKLIELVCAEARQRGASFVYVRPNENSFPILAAQLSFAEVHNIAERRYFLPSLVIHRKFGIPPGLVRALGADWIMRKLVLPSSSSSVTVTPVDRFGHELDELWERIHLGYAFSLERTSSYLNWRYSDSPTKYLLWVADRNGQVAGYLVGFVSDFESMGYIVDLFCDPNDTATAATLVKTGMEAMLNSGVRAISTWVLPTREESACWRILTRAFPRVGEPRLHFVMRFLDATLDESRLPSSGWRWATGDCDGI
jgi:GNAT superfamily N-acetyltransferase